MGMNVNFQFSLKSTMEYTSHPHPKLEMHCRPAHHSIPGLQIHNDFYVSLLSHLRDGG